MSTIVRYEGNGAETQFPYSFPNFNDKYNELESRVVDANNGVVAGYVITLLEGIATVTPAPKADEFVEIYIKLEETPVTEFNRSTHRITEDNLNDSIYQNLTTAQAALDGRSKNRQVPEDMNGQRVINVAQGVNPGDAVNVQQLSDNIGNIDALVQRAEDAADESELYRDESLAASVDSANSAAAALVSETNAATSEARANTMFKGEWETDYPNGTDTGYLIGDTVLYQNNQYKSIINNNTSVPTSTLNTEWLFYLPGAVSSEAQAASFFQTYLQGDGVETDFDLTAINPTWLPKIDDNVFLVLVNGETDLDWTIVVNQEGHSILRFLTAPAESNDTNKNNIFVVGGSPNITLIDDPMPVGSIIPFSVETLPQGFLECNGSTVQAATYPELVSYLTGDPLASQAVLPDLRGVTLRGLDSGRGLDAGRLINTYQEDEYKAHIHEMRYRQGIINTSGGGTALFNRDGNTDPFSDGTAPGYSAQPMNTSGGNETRMKNHSVVYAIKAFGTVVNAGGIDLNGLEQDVLNNTNTLAGLKTVTGYFHVRDQKATGAQGGTSVSGTQTRQLNTIVPNPTGMPTISGASLANNRVTLPAGTYEIKGYAPSITSRGTRAIVHNVTDSQDLLIGTSAFIDAGGEYGNTYSFVEGMITLDGTKELVLNHSIETGRATFGLGYRANRAPYEVYAYLIIKKLGD